MGHAEAAPHALHVDTLKLTLPNQMPYLPLAQSFVREAAAHFGFQGVSLSQIDLAVEEAVTNVMQHGYDAEESQAFDIICEHLPGGWGTRVFLTADGPVFVYAHLQNVGVGPGQVLEPGTVFAEVGGPPENGNWHPQLHVQAIRAGLLHEILLERFQELDGYTPKRVTSCSMIFPIPGPTLVCKTYLK